MEQVFPSKSNKSYIMSKHRVWHDIMQNDAMVRLRHNDRILFGNNHLFRTNFPNRKPCSQYGAGERDHVNGSRKMTPKKKESSGFKLQISELMDIVSEILSNVVLEVAHQSPGHLSCTSSVIQASRVAHVQESKNGQPEADDNSSEWQWEHAQDSLVVDWHMAQRELALNASQARNQIIRFRCVFRFSCYLKYICREIWTSLDLM